MQTTIGGSDLIGSLCVASNKGFIVSPSVTKKEFKIIEKALKVKGTSATANYGDKFVGNSVIANSKAVIVGSLTSGHELNRIDEGLSGE